MCEREEKKLEFVTVATPRSLVPKKEPHVAIKFYRNNWDAQLSILPAALQKIKSDALMDDVTTALSSCHLSRTLPQHKSYTASTRGESFRPDANHESVSYEFYNGALRKVAALDPDSVKRHQAALVLFCYLEASMGSFGGYRVHSNVLRDILNDEGLAAAWMEIEMQVWMRRVYFGTLEFHRTSGPFGGWKGHGRPGLLMNLWESVRLNYAAVIDIWEGRDLNHHVKLLNEQENKLDELMGERFILPDSTGAVRFNSHSEAMECAYYVAARIMQSSQVFQAAVGSWDKAYEEAEIWIARLIRIAEGISWQDCVHRNNFTVGFSSLLLTAILRCHSLNLSHRLQDWLENKLSGDTFEEGSFPVFQVLKVMQLIHNEKENGRDVMALFQTVDDGGGTGKLGSYNSQRLSSLMVYARGRSTGELHSHVLAL